MPIGERALVTRTWAQCRWWCAGVGCARERMVAARGWLATKTNHRPFNNEPWYATHSSASANTASLFSSAPTRIPPYIHDQILSSLYNTIASRLYIHTQNRTYLQPHSGVTRTRGLTSVRLKFEFFPLLADFFYWWKLLLITPKTWVIKPTATFVKHRNSNVLIFKTHFLVSQLYFSKTVNSLNRTG